jgi:hypothetical protein
MACSVPTNVTNAPIAVYRVAKKGGTIKQPNSFILGESFTRDEQDITMALLVTFRVFETGIRGETETGQRGEEGNPIL